MRLCSLWLQAILLLKCQHPFTYFIPSDTSSTFVVVDDVAAMGSHLHLEAVLEYWNCCWDCILAVLTISGLQCYLWVKMVLKLAHKGHTSWPWYSHNFLDAGLARSITYFGVMFTSAWLQYGLSSFVTQSL